MTFILIGTSDAYHCYSLRMARYGPKPRLAEERFWDHVEAGSPDGCWEWAGAKVHGYGFLRGGIGRPRWVKAHRLSWEIAHGEPVPEGRQVLHHCDNPPCVNPAHLYVGGYAENMRDRAVRDRGKEQRGSSNTNAKVSDADVAAIRETIKTGRSQAEVGRMFGLSQPQVSRIVRGVSWI